MIWLNCFLFDILLVPVVELGLLPHDYEELCVRPVFKIFMQPLPFSLRNGRLVRGLRTLCSRWQKFCLCFFVVLSETKLIPVNNNMRMISSRSFWWCSPCVSGPVSMIPAQSRIGGALTVEGTGTGFGPVSLLHPPSASPQCTDQVISYPCYTKTDVVTSELPCLH